jgi:hypothetical protein
MTDDLKAMNLRVKAQSKDKCYVNIFVHALRWHLKLISFQGTSIAHNRKLPEYARYSHNSNKVKPLNASSDDVPIGSRK